MNCQLTLCQSCALLAVWIPDVVLHSASLAGGIWVLVTTVVWQSLLPVWFIAAALLEAILHF